MTNIYSIYYKSPLSNIKIGWATIAITQPVYYYNYITNCEYFQLFISIRKGKFLLMQ